MYIHLRKFSISVLFFILFITTILFLANAIAEEIILPIPIPLMGDFGQAGLYFDGLPYSVSPDITSIWCDTPGVLSFVIKGDIIALYHWHYDKGHIELSHVKCSEENADSFLLEGAQDNHIQAFFEQDQCLYGIDGLYGNLMQFSNEEWKKIGSINWEEICELIGFEQIIYKDISNNSYQFAKTNSILYCLIPNSISSPFLVAADLQTGESYLIDYPGIREITPYEGDDLLIKTGIRILHYKAASGEFIDSFKSDGTFVYDRAAKKLYYENKQLLYESKDLLTSREICTPQDSDPYKLVVLPQDKLAVYWENGISIVNTALSPGKRLQIEDFSIIISNSSEKFLLANPDVTIESFNTTSYNEHPEAYNGAPDIFTGILISDISKEASDNNIVSFDLSDDLLESIQIYYPQIQDGIKFCGELYAIPRGVSVTCYQADQTAWELAGSPDLPQTIDALIQQVKQLAVYDSDDDVQTYLEELLYDLTIQYVAQYQDDLIPLRFDTSQYRSILNNLQSIAGQGVVGSNLYFSAYFVRDAPWLLGELGRANQLPFSFPTFEPGQKSALIVNLDLYTVNSQTDDLDLAIRYLEFVMKNADEDLKFALSPQYHLFDIITKQQQIVEYTMDNLVEIEAGQDISGLDDYLSQLYQIYRQVQEKTHSITLQGYTFYRNNAINMSLNGFVCYDFIWTHFSSFLQGKLSVDELIDLLNERAYDQ